MIWTAVGSFALATIGFFAYERMLHGKGIKSPTAAYLGIFFLLLGLAAQAGDFVRMVKLGQAPFGQLESAMAGLSICFVTLGLVFIFCMRSWLLGVVVAPVALIMSVMALIFPAGIVSRAENLYEMSPVGLALHAVLGYAGYAAFFTATMGGVLFLMQHHQLRRKHLGLLFERLPSLERSSRLMAIGIGSGLIFFAGSIGIAGSSLQALVPIEIVLADPNVRTVVLAWFYAVSIAGVAARTGWARHRTATLSVILGFLIVAGRVFFASEVGLHD